MGHFGYQIGIGVFFHVQSICTFAKLTATIGLSGKLAHLGLYFLSCWRIITKYFHNISFLNVVLLIINYFHWILSDVFRIIFHVLIPFIGVKWLNNLLRFLQILVLKSLFMNIFQEDHLLGVGVLKT